MSDDVGKNTVPAPIGWDSDKHNYNPVSKANLAPPFQKGVSGNPKGRPPGSTLSKRVKSLTEGGARLVGFWMRVMEDPNEKMDHRIRCSENLAKSGWGPLQPEPLDKQNSLDNDENISLESLEDVLKLPT